ncbi:MAG: VOC family protein [Spirochaetaceae bacterium]|nr:VOC family protein [Myxococcales bacterium]MCB9726821.1 VOC family protein [Spirochaetaceae bacterium]HPG28130.1 VOC family protein [Myxococcota bacterium]
MSLGIQSFSHVVMQVGDLEAAIAFYGGLLGLERTFEQPYPDPAGGAPLRAVGFRAGPHVMLELMGRPGEPREIDGRAAPILALAVADIEAADRALRAAGETRHRPPVEMAPGIFMLFLRDPDGRTIELVQFPAGARSSVEHDARSRPAATPGAGSGG